MKNASQQEGSGIHGGTLFDLLRHHVDMSFVRTLRSDPEQEQFLPNKTSRQVRGGHYVLVQPTALPNPFLVASSPSLMASLGMSDDEAKSELFVRFFSGDIAAVKSVAPNVSERGWATPYALSIFGQEMTSNCPFRNGNGYGDGRAISVLEVAVRGFRWELQLKGGGTTPFCRGGDGRAVLRSSIREFLASEAMHHLGVPTCRTLCLIASKTEKVGRMWYTEGSESEDPDKYAMEPTAIATRVAPSLIRVGQIELFGRRCRTGAQEALQELTMIVEHAIEREYPLIASTAYATPGAKILAFVAEFGKRLAHLAAEWIRVGYCQGNFNSDNCAVGGRTLDFGPFGFVEKYSASFQMWTGGGEHFSFLNQPTAAAMNFKMLCTAVAPLLARDKDELGQLSAILKSFPKMGNDAVVSMFARKLGLQSATGVGQLVQELLQLMEDSAVDYTIFWRELSQKLPSTVKELLPSGGNSEESCFYKADLDEALQSRWTAWMTSWQSRLRDEARPRNLTQSQMLSENPKFVPREWMLVEAYRPAVDRGDMTALHQLHRLFQDPYGEHLDDGMSAKYYRKASNAALTAGGTARMS